MCLLDIYIGISIVSINFKHYGRYIVVLYLFYILYFK